MGFDVYGMNPAMREIDESIYPTFNKYNPMEFSDRMEIFKKEEGLEDKFYREMNEREEENPGVYFRNNVWWWRPLWNYVCSECEDILSEDDYNAGCSNEGHLITQDKDADHERYIADGGQKYVDGWNWADSYPFDVENVRAFARFCSESGGFEIC